MQFIDTPPSSETLELFWTKALGREHASILVLRKRAARAGPQVVPVPLPCVYNVGAICDESRRAIAFAEVFGVLLRLVPR